MKRCPTCGAACGDADIFCESDGTRLAGVPIEGASPEASVAATPPATAAPDPKTESAFEPSSKTESRPPKAKARAVGDCPFCGAASADDGDGYCSSCGRKLVPAATTAPAPPSPPSDPVKVPGFKILRAVGEGESIAVDPNGEDTLLLLGSEAAIDAEARALQSLASEPLPGVRTPIALSRGSVGARAFLALSAPDYTRAKKLWDAGPELAVDHAIALLERLFMVGERLHAVGYDLAPLPDDLLLHGDELGLTRIRGERASPGRPLDAKTIAEAIGECLLPEPGVRSTPRLVRLLAPNRVANEGTRPTLNELRHELALVKDELAAELPQGVIADLADPGLWRPYQQDATAIAEGTTVDGDAWKVLVVCDGVSSSPVAGRASTAAARATCDALAHFARSPDLRRESAASAVSQAIRAAHLIVCSSHVAEPHMNPPGTTIVAAFVHKRRVTVGWVGDSRAYWFTARGGEQLTRDHSWVNEAIARGEVKSEDEVEGALAHTITKCLGPLEVGDAPLEIEPDVKTRDLPTSGTLMLCSDGLWNYASKVPELALVMKAAGDPRAAWIARFLVSYALARGGQDNVSVAVYTHAG